MKQKFMQGPIVPVLYLLLLAGCKKVDVNNENKAGHVQNTVFKNAATAPPEFAADVNIIQNHFAGNNPFGAGANGAFLWQRIGTMQITGLVIVPYTLNNNFGGFLLLNKLTPAAKVEMYNFGANFVKGNHTFNSRDAFITGILLNKMINGVTSYQFTSAAAMPYLFRRFTKIDDQPVKPKPADKITVHIETPVDNMLAMSFPLCQTQVCDWVETPNFQFQWVCWYQQGCGDEDPWGPFGGGGSFIDPYSSPTGGGGGSGGSGGGSGVSFDEMVTFVTDTMNLTDAQSVAVYQEDPLTYVELYFYLKGSSQPSRKGIAQAHLDAMAFTQYPPDTAYRNLSWRHRNTANNYFLWFEDTTWLDNPDNFNLDIDWVDPQQIAYKLTPEEKRLAGIFPVQAVTIASNVKLALTVARARVPSVTGGLNDKQDAFRHAFFNAINTKNCFMSFIPPMSAEQIVRLFANAHESEVPAALALEKQMDLFNNEVGINYAAWLFSWTSDAAVADAMMNKLNNGELRYLSPLDLNASPTWPTGLNGITNATTIIPTNQ